jgi:hypothetical protein
MFVSISHVALGWYPCYTLSLHLCHRCPTSHLPRPLTSVAAVLHPRTKQSASSSRTGVSSACPVVHVPGRISARGCPWQFHHWEICLVCHNHCYRLRIWDSWSLIDSGEFVFHPEVAQFLSVLSKAPLCKPINGCYCSIVLWWQKHNSSHNNLRL